LAAGNDANALAETLGKAIDLGADARCKLGIRAREKVTREYSEKTMVESYLKTYERVVAEWGGR